jgi:hypothetical protein
MQYIVGPMSFVCDRTIMSPFCESVKMAAPPLNKFPCSKTAPPLPETTALVLTSLPSPFYKSHCLPRLGAAPCFPWPAWQFGPAIKLCSMDMNFLMSFLWEWHFFLTFGAETRDQVEFPALTLLSRLSSGIWAALLGPPILESATLSLAHREVPPSQHAFNHHPPPANLPLRPSLPQWVLFTHRAVVFLSFTWKP